MPYSLPTLRTELQLPKYAAWVAVQDRASILASINAVDQSIDIKRADIAGSEILEACDAGEFQTGVNAPTMPQCSYYESVTQQASVRLVDDQGNDTRILKSIKTLFQANGAAGAAPQTRARLNAIALRKGSRSEQLFGAGYVVSEQNVADALA